MISYALICDNEHRFDAWFKTGMAYDEQHGRALVACPVCGSVVIEKALMAPAVARAGSDKMDVSNTVVDQVQLRSALRALRDKVVGEAENVGDRFADEARKIHYKDTPARDIYGRASHAEVVDLVEEGVQFLPLPTLPDEQN